MWIVTAANTHGKLGKLPNSKSFSTYNALSRHCKQQDTVADEKNMKIYTSSNRSKNINLVFFGNVEFMHYLSCRTEAT